MFFFVISKQDATDWRIFSQYGWLNMKLNMRPQRSLGFS